ncbi:MAG: VanZ family protein [Cyanobacteria bacterium J06597_1]
MPLVFPQQSGHNYSTCGLPIPQSYLSLCMKVLSNPRPESVNVTLTVLAVSATLITILLCSLPNSTIDPLYDLLRMVVRAFFGGGRGHGGDSPISTDKLAHFGVFAIVSALWMLRFRSPNANVWVLIGAIALGAGIEIEQGLWLEDRSADTWDLMADTVGALFGINCVGLYRYFTWSRRQKRLD